MKNLRELFNLYHAGFQDFGPWLDHHIEMHRRHPLECAEFGAEWLRRWDAVGRLLYQRAEMRELIKGKWCVSLFIGYRLTTVSDYIVKAQELHNAEGCGLRVVLLDGTIVRVWGQQNERQATLYICGRYPAWRIDARGTVSEMLERGEKRSQAKGLVMYRYAVKVVDDNGVIVKQWEKNRA